MYKKPNQGNKKKPKKGEPEQPTFVRVPFPKDNQVLGLVEQRLGGSRMRVRCLDGKARICRIPGRMKRRLWVREGDVVMVEPWELDSDTKGDVIYKYRPNQVEVLRKKGMLKGMDEFGEF